MTTRANSAGMRKNRSKLSAQAGTSSRAIRCEFSLFLPVIPAGSTPAKSGLLVTLAPAGPDGLAGSMQGSCKGIAARLRLVLTGSAKAFARALSEGITAS
jgi:hypothetical protein